MVGTTGKATNRTGDVLGQYTRAEREAQWGNMNGVITAVNYDDQTASIQPSYKPKFNGELVDMPELLEVPIDQPSGGFGGFTFPYQVGDQVSLSPSMRSTENFNAGDGDDSGEWTRSHHISDMRASLIGGTSTSSPMQNFDSQNAHLRFSPDGSYGIRGSKDGKVAIEGAQGNIYTLLADFMELVAEDGLNIKSGSSQGSGIHELENKAALIEIAGKIRAMAL